MDPSSCTTITSSHLISLVARVSLEARQSHGTLQEAKRVSSPCTMPSSDHPWPGLARPDLPGGRVVPLVLEPPADLVHPGRDSVWERVPRLSHHKTPLQAATPQAAAIVPEGTSPSCSRPGLRGHGQPCIGTGTSSPQPLTHGRTGDPTQSFGARPSGWSLCPHGAHLPGWPLSARLSLGTRGQTELRLAPLGIHLSGRVWSCPRLVEA